MKVTGIISALVFAHAALGQAADSTSATASTLSVSGARSATSASPAASASSSAHGSQSRTRTSSSTASDPTPTGSTGSIGSLTESHTGDSNPLIPQGISDSCSTFLNTLNSDTTVANCLTPLNNALSAFTSGPGSASAVSKTLSSLCSTNSCSSSNMRTKLTEFKDACSDELAASNEIIVKQYDIWYSLIPFKSAICVTDTNAQDYCLLKASSSSSSTSKTRRSDVSYAARHLTNTVHKRAQTVLMPNVDTYRNSHLMYLFTSPDMDAAQLCTPCTQKIVAKYIGFEYATPYALGLNKSPLLGGQAPLWAAMQEKCSSDFTETITKTAGVATADQFSGGPATTAASSFTTLVAAFAAALFALF